MAGALAVAGTGGFARAAEVRLVTLLAGVSPGSGADGLVRAVVPFLTRHLVSTELAVRNLPGEGGLTALKALADAPASGATLGWVTSPTLSARMVDRGADGLLDRLVLLGAVAREPIAFVSPAASPLESVQELIRRAGEDADAIPLGTPPPGSPPHLAAMRLQVLTQTRLTIITFPSAAAARQAVLAGNVSAAALGLSDVIAPLRDGKLVGLGIAARKRAGILPDLPILTEAGVPLSASIRRGLAAPARVAPDIAAPLIAALQAVSTDPEFQAAADELGLLATWIDGATWTAQAETERAALAKLWDAEPWLQASGG